MPYSDIDYKDTNVNYLNKDFPTLKRNLIEYAKTYFPNTYKDFNETSPGMMLIEMSAYVGDVLSFYVDQQYREMLLPLAEERKNVVNIARMLGYKVKPTVSALTNLKVVQTVNATGTDDDRVPDFSTDAVTINKGLKVTSTSNPDVIFETLGEIDFTLTGSITWEESARDSSDITSKFDLIAYVKAISGEAKTKTFTVGAPTKFLQLTLPETNVIDVISVYDTNNNRWYGVDYLAQDRVPLEKHYSTDATRSTSVNYNTNGELLAGSLTDVEFSLRYIQTSKRFITQVNDDNTTSLVFGNGILRSGQTIGSAYLDTEQVGITVPGQSENLDTSINDLLGDEYDTLGEIPAHTTLTVKYRVGGGISSNVAANDLTSMGTPSYLAGSGATLTTTNLNPAYGGADQQSVNEIRERAKAHFTTQNRCVTKEDFEARTLSMPAKFGNIAKVYVNRVSPTELFTNIAGLGTSQWQCESNGGYADDGFFSTLASCEEVCILSNETTPGVCTEITGDDALVTLSEFQTLYGGYSSVTPSIEIYTLGYDANKNLARLEDTLDTNTTTYTAHLVHQNLREYLSNYRMITDEIVLKLGYIINFGVVFDVSAHVHANKQEVKLACIQKIIDYFDIEKMHFRQPIYISQLQYELMGIDGVRSVNDITITQGPAKDENLADLFIPNLFTYSWDSENSEWIDTDSAAQEGYGYRYDFTGADVLVNGVINPPVTPAVFELKNPTENIIGVVR